ncbi:hypothetical protein J6590_013412 [Homalodisca vitripennis]|nr:hypothetical protein J6590_013412 [Homalodisca vitripennis]
MAAAGFNTNADVPCAARFGDSGFVCVCNATYCDTFTYPSRSTENFTHIFTSNHTPGYNFHWGTVQDASTLPIILSDDTIKITINTSHTHQRLKGIGSSFTDSFGFNVKSLSDGAGQNLLNSCFAPNGNEYKLARVPAGASDFSPRTYTYDDFPDDVTLSHFSLADEDYMYKIPIINAAKKISRHNLYLFATPWTSPSWTKTNEYYLPGYLQRKYYSYWAKYLIRFLEEYKENGLDFWGFSLSNEPLSPIDIGFAYLNNNIMWMPMDQRVFVKEYLGPLLRASPFNKTKLFTLEDNRTFLKYWIDTMMADADVAKYIDGISLHWYGDTTSSPEILDEVFKAYNKDIMYSEACVTMPMDPTKVVDLGSWKRGSMYAEDIIDVLNHMSLSFIDWNMALDTEGGPVYTPSGPVDSPIIVNASADEFYKNPMFYVLGHFSKFIDEGSYRVHSTSQPSSSISHLATTNPDGSTSTFVYNPTNRDLTVWLHDVIKERTLKITAISGSLNTVVWW